MRLMSLAAIVYVSLASAFSYAFLYAFREGRAPQFEKRWFDCNVEGLGFSPSIYYFTPTLKNRVSIHHTGNISKRILMQIEPVTCEDQKNLWANWGSSARKVRHYKKYLPIYCVVKFFYLAENLLKKIMFLVKENFLIKMKATLTWAYGSNISLYNTLFLTTYWKYFKYGLRNNLHNKVFN